MKRVLLLVLGVLLVSGTAFAQEKAKSDKTMSASGSVTAVSASSITVKGKAAEWTFDVDKDTHVSVQGATKKTAALKDNKLPAQITEYVKVGDTVTVKYHDMGATKHAADVMVRTSMPGAPKKK
jgi:hypothetical protein